MRTEIMIAIPMRVFKKKYDWLKEYPKISFNNTDFPGEYLEIPIWNADRVLHGCGINSGIILFKLKTSDSMLFIADVSRYEKIKGEFISFCGASSTDEEAEGIQTELLRTNAAIAKIENIAMSGASINDRDLDRRMRHKDNLEKRLRLIGVSEPVSYVGMFNDILTHEDIESIQIENNSLLIQTKQIVIQHEDIDYLIGKFIITIPKTNGDITIKNQDRQIDGYHHPHISNLGIPCWGGAAN